MNSIINNILLHVEFMNSGIYRFVDNDDRVFAILPVDSRSIVVWSCHRSRRRRRRGGEQWQGGAGASRVDIVLYFRCGISLLPVTVTTDCGHKQMTADTCY